MDSVLGLGEVQSIDALRKENKNMKVRLAAISDLDAIASMEKVCFPAAEAAARDSFRKRLECFSNHFWVLEEDGKIVSCINGMVTDDPVLKDEMYEDAAIHNENGAWQMIFGVTTIPDCQGKGYASKLMEQVIADCREQKRKGIVLTCKDSLIKFYERFGFIDEGKSDSEHGGVSWNEMRITF